MSWNGVAFCGVCGELQLLDLDAGWRGWSCCGQKNLWSLRGQKADAVLSAFQLGGWEAVYALPFLIYRESPGLPDSTSLKLRDHQGYMSTWMATSPKNS